jgi:hypothetical protein
MVFRVKHRDNFTFTVDVKKICLLENIVLSVVSATPISEVSMAAMSSLLNVKMTSSGICLCHLQTLTLTSP